MKKATKSYRTKLYLALTGILASIMLLATFLTTWAAYPTEAHRAMGREMTTISAQASTREDGLKIYDSAEFKALTNSKEFQYTSLAEPIGYFLGFILYIVLIGLTYNYLRKRKISPTRRDLGMTTLIVTAASAIELVISYYPKSLISGTYTPFDPWIIPTMVFSIGATAAITFAIAYAFERYYNKHHSFLVE